MGEQDGAKSLGSASNQGYLGLVHLVDSSMEEDKPMQIHGGGNHTPRANAMHTKMTVGMNCQEQVALSQKQAPLAPATHALLALGEVHVPYLPGSGIHVGSYYLCNGRMSVEDQIYLVPWFDLMTQKQVLRSVWRPRSGTFKTVLETIPRAVPNCPKVP
jgi:hypothetical protein